MRESKLRARLAIIRLLNDPTPEEVAEAHTIINTLNAERAKQANDADDKITCLAAAIQGQVAKFSDRRLNDGDDIWRAQELELRRAVSATANAICVALRVDAKTFAAACGLYVSDGRDSYSDCAAGELSWEKPRDPSTSSALA